VRSLRRFISMPALWAALAYCRALRPAPARPAARPRPCSVCGGVHPPGRVVYVVAGDGCSIEDYYETALI
jgi:hypothetical protein